MEHQSSGVVIFLVLSVSGLVSLQTVMPGCRYVRRVRTGILLDLSAGAYK